MWIKSQDKKTLVNVNNVAWFEIMLLDDAYGIVIVNGETSCSIGYYATEQEAMRVLDILETLFTYSETGVYQMPPRKGSKLWGGEEHGNYDSNTK